MFQTKLVERLRTHILYSINPPPKFVPFVR